MDADFDRLAGLLKTEGPYESTLAFNQRCYRRLVGALSKSQHRPLGSGDLVALISEILRTESSLSSTLAPPLMVPINRSRDPWPSQAQWEACGISASIQGDQYLLTPRRWEPRWLSDRNGTAIIEPLFDGAIRRTYSAVRGDPFLSEMKLRTYSCEGQREAVRAILSVPEGATVAVNLPTGAGKSLCAHLPALLKSQRSGISVMIVPTTALAIDQERSLQHLVNHHMAYVGGQSASEDRRRKDIRSRVRDGRQRIVFTSPEGILGSLRPALYEATRKGLLRALVVDEAHMVEQWGDEFRSGFQEIAGLRRDLLRNVPEGSKPFSTILLSATMTLTALETLKTLFGGPSQFVLVSAAQLRPEPAYWSVRARDPAEQTSIILESLRYLPRPLVLYLTEPRVAEAWFARLHQEGYRRVDIVTGNTANADRGAVIERWRNAETDIVVATSAFGLGVDYGEVRAVIHGTVPESIDRYYQELGRAGRDGRASASLVVHTPGDVDRARQMNRKKIIGITRGRERWGRMYENHVALESNRVRVPIDVQPSWGAGDMEMDSDLNRAWYVRTLTLMSRARLLELDAEPPPSPNDSEAADGYDLAWKEHQRHRVVSILSDSHMVRETWEHLVVPTREELARADRRSHQLMCDVLAGARCVGEILGDAYDIAAGAGHEDHAGIHVARACGGCAYDRGLGRAPYAEPMPTGLPRWPTDGRLGDAISHLCAGRSRMAVFYEDMRQHQLARCLQWLVGQGIRSVVAPAETLDVISEGLYRPHSEQWVFTYALEEFWFMRAPHLPLLLLLPPGTVLPLHLRESFEDSRGGSSLRLLLAHRDTQDPARPPRVLRESLASPSFTFDELAMAVGL